MSTIENQTALVNELTLKFLAGDISTDEMTQLKNLLDSNGGYLQLFLEIKESWTAASCYQSNIEPNQTNYTWQNVKNSITWEEKSFFPGRFLKVAALWLLLMGMGVVIGALMVGHKTTKATGTCEISTPMGSRSHTILPDGSEVWLNAGTTLKYPQSFSSKQRDVYLIGEAFFKVSANKKWPFIVHASDVRVKALGTAFNVKAYPADKTVVTTLVEGIVNMENEGTAKKEFAYTLKPKEKLTYFKTPEVQKTEKRDSDSKQEESTNSVDQGSVVVTQNVNTTLSTSWKDARWVVSGETLDNLALLLERRFGVKINVLSDDLSHYKFSGTIENETLEQVLKYLKLTTPIKYTVRKGFVDLTINENMKDKYSSFLKQNVTHSN